MRKMISYSYDRKKIMAGILHIGVGNFHRAHQEYYVDRLLGNRNCAEWGICGAMLLPGDERLYRALKSNGNEYTLTVFGRDGSREVRRIGSLVELLWAGESPEAIVDKIADKSIRIITLTITEGGYNISRVTGEFVFDNPDIRHDIACPEHPCTVFGYVAEGLRKRRDAGNGPLTILSCDNLQHNGDTARKSFMSFITAQDSGLADWVAVNVAFPNCMVDRITPAVKPEDAERLNRENGTSDSAPVYCEDFVQWVVEDVFPAGRPPLDEVGVEFTDDVSLWENIKLSLLNASHTMLSYPSFLGGFRKVDEAVGNEYISGLVRKFMDIDITPHVPAPPGVSLDIYKKTLAERLGNRAVSDQVARLCADGISKFPVYIVPNLKKMIVSGADTVRVAYLLACYRHYLKYRIDDNGEMFDINEPWLTDDDRSKFECDDPLAFLSFSPFAGIGLESCGSFAGTYVRMVDEIRRHGAIEVLKTVL